MCRLNTGGSLSEAYYDPHSSGSRWLESESMSPASIPSQAQDTHHRCLPMASAEDATSRHVGGADHHLVPSARHRILGCNNASSFCGSGERSLAWPCSLAPHCSPLVGAWRRWISPLRAHLVSVEEYGISVPQPVKTQGRVAPRCASFSRARTSGRLHRGCAIWRKGLSTSDS